MKCNVTRQTATRIQQADHISGFSRTILGRSYFDLIKLFRVTAGWS